MPRAFSFRRQCVSNVIMCASKKVKSIVACAPGLEMERAEPQRWPRMTWRHINLPFHPRSAHEMETLTPSCESNFDSTIPERIKYERLSRDTHASRARLAQELTYNFVAIVTRRTMVRIRDPINPHSNTPAVEMHTTHTHKRPERGRPRWRPPAECDATQANEQKITRTCSGLPPSDASSIRKTWC